ncbi:MAG: hypothetical protein GWO16_01645 [Gammaproteobacteria bacterium]|nr:hypothetical protein [Gammaproteobacteria bacterium]NIR96832.1 hypothetical protein [Gammaproteobacteria bacterium]NIT62547.1 hypothetical protein [Gammaproteobacteria bacterium]NIV19471.1 hypothetical protein [Gammaproteobacteria bacterium]NIY31127.1 hypothetical protein [Gammaproteobacteria bacterium]
MNTKSKRILVGKLERKSRASNISQDEVAQAIRNFQSQGGLIKQLPPQEAQKRAVVGAHVGSAYESVIEY